MEKLRHNVPNQNILKPQTKKVQNTIYKSQLKIFNPKSKQKIKKFRIQKF